MGGPWTSNLTKKAVQSISMVLGLLDAKPLKIQKGLYGPFPSAIILFQGELTTNMCQRPSCKCSASCIEKVAPPRGRNLSRNHRVSWEPRQKKKKKPFFPWLHPVILVFIKRPTALWHFAALNFFLPSPRYFLTTIISQMIRVATLPHDE